MSTSFSAEKNWHGGREGDALDPAIQPDYRPYTWPDQPPDDFSHPRSTFIRGIQFTGRYANYTGADTFYPTWAPDGELYSPWTDGYISTTRAVEPYTCTFCKPGAIWEAGPRKRYHCHSNVEPTCTGQARLVGASPLNLEVEALGKMFSGKDLYPCVSIVARGVFYIGTYEAFAPGGRFNGFRYSHDWNHWTEATARDWKNPYWQDTRSAATDFFSSDGHPRRFNVPHAVVFGQDNRLSPDGRIYLSAHGSLPEGRSNWDKGDAIYLCRVEADPAAVANPAAYEFFQGHTPDGTDLWTRDVTASQPILAWPKHLGSESITFVPGLNRYLLTAARLCEEEQNLPYNVLTFWEAERLTGPYRLIQYLRDWGPQTYFPNIPAKFISQDGRRLWLCVSSNYSSQVVPQPFGCRYAASFHEIVLDFPGEAPFTPPQPGRSLTPLATVLASTTADGYQADSLLLETESAGKGWAALHGIGDWVELTWPTPQTLTCVRLLGQPGHPILRGTLQFSDGSEEVLRAPMSERALAPSEISFPARAVSSVRFRIDACETAQPGLTLFAVF